MPKLVNSVGVEIHNPIEIIEVLTKHIPPKSTVKNNKKIEYFNLPTSFDIETSSFYNSNGQKQASMYIWMMDINGGVIIGRYWVEWLEMLNTIKNELSLNLNRRLIVWVHNLAYEFGFIQHFFDWEKVFAIDSKTPLYALTKDGIEFRCSYMLSGMKLSSTAKEIRNNPIEKLEGDLNHDLVRNAETQLTDTELGYCVNDVRILEFWIRQKIADDVDITKIPLTKTGYVRQYCRNACFYGDARHDGKNSKNRKYSQLMKALTLDVDEYKQLKRAFQGGFTHASAYWVRNNKPIADVVSYDFTSAYPSVMLCEEFPMSKGKLVNINSDEEFDDYIENYCCLFDIEFYKLQSKTIVEHPLSKSRCYNIKNEQVDNGRIVSADYLWTTITEQDYMTLKEFYSWKDAPVSNFRIYKKQYLPKDLILSIIKLYEDKTTLKGVAGAEVEYQLSKGMLNSCYGMCVTDICRDEIDFTDKWTTTKCETEELIQKQIDDYNKSRNRFLSYAWGIWVTAYARRNLFTGILECGTDYIYADTDSIKIVNAEKHQQYFDEYNSMVEVKLQLMCDYYNIDFNRLKPKTIKGVEKLIGVWDYDGHYDLFKTLGAKKYMIFRESENELSLTISGLNKVNAVPYILQQCNIKHHKRPKEEREKNPLPFVDDIDKIKLAFDFFNDEMEISAEHTGCMTHTYCDYSCEGVVTDYLGHSAEYQELSFIHLEKSTYKIDLADDFMKYLGWC